LLSLASTSKHRYIVESLYIYVYKELASSLVVVE